MGIQPGIGQMRLPMSMRLVFARIGIEIIGKEEGI